MPPGGVHPVRFLDRAEPDRTAELGAEPPRLTGIVTHANESSYAFQTAAKLETTSPHSRSSRPSLRAVHLAGNDFHAASDHQRWAVVASRESAQRQTAFEEVIGAFGPFGTDGSWITTRLSLPQSAVDDMAVDPNRLTGQFHQS